jgi:hypothetical protein
MKNLSESTEKARAAQQQLRELAEQVAPGAILKTTAPPTPLPKLKPERRILQSPARPLVVAAG